MISNLSASRKDGNKFIIDHAQGQLQTFFDELKNKTKLYRTIAGLSEQVAQEYRGRCILELLQNGHDALQGTDGRDPRRISFKLITYPKPVLIVGNSGGPFQKKDFDGLCQLGQSPKDPNKSVGNKGLGFKSVLEVSSCPEIYSIEPSENDPSFVFRFDPSVIKKIAALASELTRNDSSLRSPFDPNRRLVDWSQEHLEKYRKRVNEEQLDVSNEARTSLSPYLIPLIIEIVPHDVEEMWGTKHVTVVRLPLDGGMTRAQDQALGSVKEQLQKIDARSMIFLQHLDELIIDIDGERRTLERVVESDESISSCPRVRRKRLLVGSSDSASNHNSTHQFHVWTQIIGGENYPKQAEQIQVTTRHLPNEWPNVNRVELGVAVEEAPVPELGTFVIFLPTEIKTGTASYINAPFYGSLDRRRIDFHHDYNHLLLTNAVDLCLVAVNELLGGVREQWHGPAVIDLLSSISDVGGEDWRIMDCLHMRASEQKAELESQELISCDKGWRKPSLARLMPDRVGDNLIGAEHWRKNAGFDVVSSMLDGRQDAVRALIRRLDGSPDPTNHEWVKTIEQMATGIQNRKIDLPWNDFLNGVVAVLPDEFRYASGPCLNLLVNTKFLPDQDGCLVCVADPVNLFFLPVQGVDDAAGFAESIPECLKHNVAFLHPSIRIHEGFDRKNTKVQQFLVNRLVKEFRRDELLKIILDTLPKLPVFHESDEAISCSELLTWAIRILVEQRAASHQQNMEVLKYLPVACNGGWYKMSETVFGPGWPDRVGNDIISLADELPECVAGQLRKTVLLPPDDPRWRKEVIHLNRWFADGGVIDGLRLHKADETNFHMQEIGCELWGKKPNGVPEDAWLDWCTAVHDDVQSPYATSFEYLLTGVHLLPEIHYLRDLSSAGRRILSKLVQFSLEQWVDGWQNVIISKCKGISWKVTICSPLCYWLKTVPWLRDGTEEELPLRCRWMVPSYLLRGQENRYRHLHPLSLELTQRLEDKPDLKSALVELGLNLYPVEEKIGPGLLMSLAGAWSEGRVASGHFNFFLGQLRHAWHCLDPKKELPSSFLVRTGRYNFSTRNSNNLDDVYLPDDGDRTRLLSDHNLPILEMNTRDAKLHAQAFSETNIRQASSLTEHCIIDGTQWTGAVEGIVSLERNSAYSWLPVPLLAVAAFGGQNREGIETQTWNHTAERLRSTRVMECQEIIVRLIYNGMVVAERNQDDACLLHGNILAVRSDVGSYYKKLTHVARVMLNRQDLESELRLVLGALEGLDNPSPEQIEAAVLEIKVEATELAQVRDRWVGIIGTLKDRIRPVLSLLRVRSIGFDEAASSIDGLNEWLFSNVNSWSSSEILEAARRSCDDHAMGLATWRALGDIASLREWNKALVNLGEPYASVENDGVREQTDAHLEEARALLRGFARHVAIETGKPEMFHEIETVSERFKGSDDWRKLWWKVPFEAVINGLRNGYAQIGGVESYLGVLGFSRNLEELRKAFQKRGIAIEPNPYEIARKNKNSERETALTIYDIFCTWVEEKRPNSTTPELPETPEELDPEAYLRLWSETELFERALQKIGDEEFLAACCGCVHINEIYNCLQIDSSAVNAKHRERKIQESEEKRKNRTFEVAGFPFDSVASDYTELWERLSKAPCPTGPRASQDQFVRLAEITSTIRFNGIGNAIQTASTSTILPVPREQVGVVGEMWAFRYLQNEFGQHVITVDAWVSSSRPGAIPLVAGEQNRTDDSLGFDFRFSHNGVRWHVEVKSTIGDDQEFELGSSQIAAAIRFSKEDQDTRWRILRVRNALSCQPKFEWLPNPLHEDFKRFFRVHNGGLRVSYMRE